MQLSLFLLNTSYKNDIYHSLVSQVVLGSVDPHWVVRNIPKSKGAAGYWKIMDFVYETLEELDDTSLSPAGITTHSFRRGSTNEAIKNFRILSGLLSRAWYWKVFVQNHVQKLCPKLSKKWWFLINL